MSTIREISSSDPLNKQVDRVEAAGFFDVDAVEAHEGVDNGLAAVRGDGVAHVACNNLYRHARFNQNAVQLTAILGDDWEHSFIHITSYTYHNIYGDYIF